jgi:hypothetical protein
LWARCPHSLFMALIKIRDTLSPDLIRRAKAAREKRPLLEAMGQSVKSLAVQAFTDPAKRAQAWEPRKDKKPHALLQKSTMLRCGSPSGWWDSQARVCASALIGLMR